jgi:hypothetical protein
MKHYLRQPTIFNFKPENIKGSTRTDRQTDRLQQLSREKTVKVPHPCPKMEGIETLYAAFPSPNPTPDLFWKQERKIGSVEGLNNGRQKKGREEEEARGCVGKTTITTTPMPSPMQSSFQ